ncbi:SSU ribosomal protein S3p (S3e) [Candidatus Karelsulcia muelleri]|uniref:Small ribosomal subunit protein uS3 n=1 Tax=Candidatus Karelsulcia muelleri TaxID=336810 RepID=A0A654M5R3_9FLAO|nr:30S ribosomal protein S3 [Candidatus Karelsulcia muelleri]AGS33451.1 30S ribosomal protein S3 (S3e) [Candidatus Karelsulcia muelleri str. Sulcia-ALF]ALP70191.1 SSU ribosomal protein S3p (S3e) [Candidatus Karelsulcia muelleri]QND78437.1 SSU ribosomal protein S3 [Candidatus Karelsulcia muelleri]
MGHKVNTLSTRLGLIVGWQSLWYSHYPERIKEDFKIRKYLENRLSNISRIYIERSLNKVIITISSSRPSIIIGKGGSEIYKLKKELNLFTYKNILIKIIEIKKPELDAVLVSKSIASQLENRGSYKKAIKICISAALQVNVEGIKIKISGRLNGAEMARKETYKEGRIPLSTFRADIDYHMTEAHTNYGIIGIKVWIMKGEIYGKKNIFNIFNFKKVYDSDEDYELLYSDVD